MRSAAGRLGTVERWGIVGAGGWLVLVAVVLALTQGGARAGDAVAGAGYMVPLAIALPLLCRAVSDRNRREWIFLGSFALFVALTLAGDVVFVLTKASRSAGSEPTVADAVYVAAYVALLPGVAAGLRPLGRLGASVAWFDAAIASAAVAYAGYVLLLAPALRHPTGATLVAAAYPLLDLAVLTSLVPVVLGLRAAVRGAGFLLGSFAAAFVADAAYAYFRLHGGSVFDTWFVLCYQLQFVLLGVGGLYAQRSRNAGLLAEARRHDVGLPLALSGFVSTVALIAHETLNHASTRPERVGFVAIVVLLIGRMLLADRNLRGMERLQRERGEELERLVAERTGELRQSREGAIRRLANVIGLRDSETGGHIERLSLYAALLAERIGLGPDEVELLRIAGPLHDIGKIAVPDSILRNPGALTARERAVMEEHTVFGHRLLSGSGQELLDFAAELALTHHEHWDGTGYPNGLAGEEIPLGGRILAICDVFDALSSDRVYRAALPLDEVLELMREGRGTHFDPALLDVFLGALPALIEVRESSRELGLEDVA